MKPGRITWIGVMLVIGGSAWAAPRDRAFLCYPAWRVHHALPALLHGDDPQTRDHADELSRDIGMNRMDVAGHFILAEIGCGAGCIELASVDALTGDVRWMPKTTSNWPIKMRQPVRFRSDSRLVIVFGQLDERGPAGPAYFLLGTRRFVPLAHNWRCARR